MAAEQRRQLCLSLDERKPGQVIAIQTEQVESVEFESCWGALDGSLQCLEICAAVIVYYDDLAINQRGASLQRARVFDDGCKFLGPIQPRARKGVRRFVGDTDEAAIAVEF
jgi:hypothetical protein